MDDNDRVILRRAPLASPAAELQLWICNMRQDENLSNETEKQAGSYAKAELFWGFQGKYAD